MSTPPQSAVIRIMCPNLACQRILAIPVKARGKIVRCRGCGMNVRVPAQKVDQQPQHPQQQAPDDQAA